MQELKFKFKKNMHANKLFFYEGNKIILVEIKELSTVSYINIRTKKYYDLAKGIFVESIVAFFKNQNYMHALLSLF